MTDFEQKIYDVIKANPGLVGREIADMLGVDKREINSTLEHSDELKTRVYKNEAYKWFHYNMGTSSSSDWFCNSLQDVIQLEYYSASYVATPHNFVIANLPAGPGCDEREKGSLCVLKNILQRGRITPLSLLLQKYFPARNNKGTMYLLNDVAPSWSYRIKGGVKSNPALAFYDKLFSVYLPEFSFVKQLVLPEASFADILDSDDSELSDIYVDFYIPQAKLVIEIDGPHHLEQSQKAIDQSRDFLLKKGGCSIIRIPVSQLKSLTSFSVPIESIRTILTKSSGIMEMKKLVESGEKAQAIYNSEMQLTEIMRFEIMLIRLLELGVISLRDETWDFLIDECFNKESIKRAVDDIFVWLYRLYGLRGVHLTKPKLRSSANGIKIRSSLEKRWAEEYMTDRDTIYLLTDYFDGRDYFRVSLSGHPIDDYSFNSDDADNYLHFFLKNLFGYEEFNDGQIAIIKSLLQRKDTIGVLPTGSGKSLCYQFACILQPCINFIICPIISLLIDQKRNLDEAGIDRTAYIASISKGDERQEILDEFAAKRYLMIWISPERFQNEKFRESLRQIESSAFSYAVIDEVHCLSEWGHDFRTSYLTLIKTIRSICNGICMVGLTATVSQYVLTDIKQEFMKPSGEKPTVRATGNMTRKELKFGVIPVSDFADQYRKLRDSIIEFRESYDYEPNGIVFTPTVNGRQNGCNTIIPRLRRDIADYEMGVYHAQLKPEQKLAAQRAFMESETNCLVATKAFGMGVNKKDIRFTVHFGMPPSLEALYQEAGRAGRDRIDSDCLVLFNGGHNPDTVLDTLFDRKSTITSIRAQLTNVKGDLNTVFFLFTSSNRGVDEEAKCASRLLKELPLDETVTNLSCRMFKDDTDRMEAVPGIMEKALYHLYLLGIVKDWTIDYVPGSNYNIFTIYYELISDDRKRENLIKYIRKYDIDFMTDNMPADTKSFYQKYLDEGYYIYPLVYWMYDNIVYSRRQMCERVYDYCNDYTTSENFKDKIEKYLKVQDEGTTLDNVVNSPADIDLWIELLREEANGGFEDCFRTAQRYTESYRNNLGLDFIFSISGICTQKLTGLEKKEITERLSSTIAWIKQQDKSKQTHIVSETAKIIASANALDEHRVIYSQCVLKYMPEYVEDLYGMLRDELSLRLLLDSFSKRLDGIIGGYKW